MPDITKQHAKHSAVCGYGSSPLISGFPLGLVLLGSEINSGFLRDLKSAHTRGPHPWTADNVLKVMWLALASGRVLTEKKEYMDHPVCPHLINARMYYMYDTTEWSHNTESINEKHLKGTVKGLSADSTAKLAQQMMAADSHGPTAFKAPDLNLQYQAFGGETATPQAKSKAKARGTKSNLDIYLKALAKAVEEVAAVDKMIVEMTAKVGDKATPFRLTLEDQREELAGVYEKLREETAKLPPAQNVLAQCKSDLERICAGLKVDVNRMKIMFSMKAVGKAKAKAKAKSQAGPGGEAAAGGGGEAAAA